MISCRTVVVRIGVSLFAASAVAQESDLKEEATVQELMEAVIIPASDVLFNVGIDPTPGEEEWLRIERNSIALTEAGDLLLLPSRSQGQPRWIDASKSMRLAGEKALAATKARDVAAFLDIGDQILESCSSCHQAYLK